jgi:hypothetical protein
MSGYEVQADANLLSAFALMIGGAVGVAFPRSDHLDLFLSALRRWGATSFCIQRRSSRADGAAALDLTLIKSVRLVLAVTRRTS